VLLGIEIGDSDLEAGVGDHGGEGTREGALPDPTLLRHQRDNYGHGFPRFAITYPAG
jgi:hypothetical protein